MTREVRPLARALSLRPVPLPGLHRSWQGAGCVAAVVGIGPVAAERATARLLATREVDRVLVVGVAGAVDPSLDIGDVVVPERVVDRATGAVYRPHRSGGIGTLLTSNAIGGVLAGEGGGVSGTAGDGANSTAGDGASTRASAAGDPSATAEAALVALSTAELPPGTSAVDMETAAIARACEARGVPWAVVRTISDVPGTLDDSVLELVGPDGALDPMAVARLLVRRPLDTRKLVQIGRDTQRAVRALTKAALLEL